MKNLILIIVLIAFIGCSEDTPTESTNFEDSYLPLQIGNEWQYEHNYYDSIYNYKVIDKQNISNKEYFVMINDYNRGDTNYIRTDNGVDYFWYLNNKEYTYRIFKDIETNSGTYNSRRLKCDIRTNDQYNINTEAGDFTNIAIVEEGTIANDGGVMFEYGKSVGLIRTWWFKGELKLVYAKIGDKIYGKKR